jgi:hypothetical protein
VRRAAVLAASVLVAWGSLEAGLSRRADLDDHGRYTAAVYMTAARNYARLGFTAEGGVPLVQGGSPELARKGRYLNWPVPDFLELGLCFKLAGATVPVARAWSAFWGFVGLVGLAWGAGALAWRKRRELAPAVLVLAFGSSPLFLYYAHAASPQAIAVALLAVAVGARLRRLAGGSRAALALQAGATVASLSVTWEPILFALAWALSDLRARRRDGLWTLAFAGAFVGAQVAFLVHMGGADAWLAKAAQRVSSPDPFWKDALRIARYGRGLGYAHALLGLAGLVTLVGRARRKSLTPVDHAALELLLAPVPWFLVFREHVAVHDVELLYFVPGLSLLVAIALEDLARRKHARVRVALAAFALVLTGAAIGCFGPGSIEHRDDWDEPRRLGAVAREVASPDEAVATSSPELSAVWEADRFVHTRVLSPEALDAADPKPRWFVLPERERATALGEALSRRAHPTERDGFLVFDLK